MGFSGVLQFQGELPSVLGSSLDELMRHVGSLRTQVLEVSISIFDTLCRLGSTSPHAGPEQGSQVYSLSTAPTLAVARRAWLPCDHWYIPLKLPTMRDHARELCQSRMCWAGRRNTLQSTRPVLCTLACFTCPCLNSGVCGMQEMSSQQEAVSAEGAAQPMDTEDVSSKAPAPSGTIGAPSRYPTLSACCLSAQHDAWLHHLASIRHAAACSYEGTGKRLLHCRSFLVHCAGGRMHCMPGASSFASAACYQDKVLFI